MYELNIGDEILCVTSSIGRFAITEGVKYKVFFDGLRYPNHFIINDNEFNVNDTKQNYINYSNLVKLIEENIHTEENNVNNVLINEYIRILKLLIEIFQELNIPIPQEYQK